MEAYEEEKSGNSAIYGQRKNIKTWSSWVQLAGIKWVKGQSIFFPLLKIQKSSGEQQDMTNGSDKRQNLWEKFETATFQHA